MLTLKAKEGLERDNPFPVGQTGLIGNPAARHASDGCDLLLMLGTDFPYSDWYPERKVVVQVDAEGAHIGRRTPVAAERDHLTATTSESSSPCWRRSRIRARSCWT